MKKAAMTGAGLAGRVTALSLPEKGNGEEVPNNNIRKSA